MYVFMGMCVCVCSVYSNQGLVCCLYFFFSVSLTGFLAWNSPTLAGHKTHVSDALHWAYKCTASGLRSEDWAQVIVLVKQGPSLGSWRLYICFSSGTSAHC